jgi:hypothetical protein
MCSKGEQGKCIFTNVELYLHSPNTPSWRGAQLKYRDNFTFIEVNIKKISEQVFNISK